MNHLFYRFPIRLGSLMKAKELPTCSLGVSIAQMLYLLIHTRYGELRSNQTFGCQIWDHEFDGHLSLNDWSAYLIDSLTSAIYRYEPRLKQVDVSVESQPVNTDIGQIRSEDYRKGAIITVRAVLVQTEEPFRFSTKLFLGQLATR